MQEHAAGMLQECCKNAANAEHAANEHAARNAARMLQECCKNAAC